MPLLELDHVFWRGRLGQESLGESLWEGTARDGDLEGIVPVKPGGLALDDVSSEVCRKGINSGEDEQVGGSASHGSETVEVSLSIARQNT